MFVKMSPRVYLVLLLPFMSQGKEVLNDDTK